jgi:hypothetical protein
LDVSLLVQTDEIDFVDGLSGSRQKDIENRQCAKNRPLAQSRSVEELHAMTDNRPMKYARSVRLPRGDLAD